MLAQSNLRLYTVVTLISFDANPSAFSEFNQTSSGQPIPYLKPFIQLSGTGEVCIPVDIASLGVPGVQDGTNATIQVQFNGGDGELYQVRVQCFEVDIPGLIDVSCSALISPLPPNPLTSLPAPTPR